MVATFALSGCLSSGASGNMNPTCAPPECQVDPLPYSIEVTPAPGSPLVAIEVPSQDANGNALVTIDPDTGLFRIQVPTPITLSGHVQVGLGNHGKALPSTILASRPSRIPGRPDVFYQASIDPVSGSYSMSVTASGGALYTLQVASADASQYPPQTFQLPVNADTEFDLTLDDPSQLLQLKGMVVDALQRPIVGMSVRALDPVTRAIVSTQTVSDANGYAIRLSKQAKSSVILEAAPGATAAAGVPQLDLPVDVSKPGAANTLTFDLAAPTMPAPAQFVYTMVGVSSSGAQTGVRSAACQFTTDLSDPSSPTGLSATYSAITLTDGEGKATVTLIPATDATRTYLLAIAPPPDSQFQTTSTTVAVGPQGGYTSSLTLASRIKVTGRVLDPSGLPLGGVAVTPGVGSVAKLVDAASQASVNQLGPAVTDSAGRYGLLLDPGSYDIGFAPDPTTGAAHTWLTGEEVQSDLDLGDELLPTGTKAQALVFDASNTPLAGADVRVYRVPAANFACPAGALSCLGAPRQVAQTTTDANGFGPVLLPATAQAAARN